VKQAVTWLQTFFLVLWYKPLYESGTSAWMSMLPVWTSDVYYLSPRCGVHI
jgi:hypothetical protein